MNSYASDQITSDRMVCLDNPQLVSGVSIVGFHAIFDFNGQPFPVFEIAKHVASMLFHCVTYVARIELFLRTSLFLLRLSPGRQPSSYKDSILEQSKRLLVSFLFGIVFYTFCRLIKANVFGYESATWSELTTLWQWTRVLLLGAVCDLLHFLPILFSVILLFPLYQFSLRNPWLCFIVFLCLPVKHEADIWIWVRLQLMGRFPFFLRCVKIFTCAGYCMVADAFAGLLKQGGGNRRLKDCLFFVLTTSISQFGLKLTYSFKVVKSGAWQYIFTPAFWVNFQMPIALFLACMSAAIRKFLLFISRLAPYSFGNYLILPVFMGSLDIWPWQNNIVSTISIFSKFFYLVLATSFTVWMLFALFLGWSVGLRTLPIPAFSKHRPKDLS